MPRFFGVCCLIFVVGPTRGEEEALRELLAATSLERTRSERPRDPQWIAGTVGLLETVPAPVSG